MSKKNIKLIVVIAAVAVAAFLAWRWWSNRQATGNGNAVAPGGSSNLNSVAPELIGGSSGPEVGPAVSLPVNITLMENSAPPPQTEDEDDEKMKSTKKGHSHNRLHKGSSQVIGGGNPFDPSVNGAGVIPPESNGAPGGSTNG